MDKLRELVRLDRQVRGAREVARLLRISPNTERRYRRRLRAAGLLEGPEDDLPSLGALQAVVQTPKRPAQERSSIEAWTPQVTALMARGHGPTAIHELLSARDPDFQGRSLSAVKRLYRALRRAQGPRAEVIGTPDVTVDLIMQFGGVQMAISGDGQTKRITKRWEDL